MINKLDFETGEGAQIHKTGLNEDLKLLAETINQLIDEVNKLSDGMEKQIELNQEILNILESWIKKLKNKPD